MRKKPIKKDPVLQETLDLLARMTPKEISEASGNKIGASTIYNWRRNKVKCPLGYTLDAALLAAGYERPIRKIRRTR